MQRQNSLKEILEKTKDLMETKVKITKSLYKAIDSYHRRQIWEGKQLIKNIRELYGLAKADEI